VTEIVLVRHSLRKGMKSDILWYLAGASQRKKHYLHFPTLSSSLSSLKEASQK